MKRLILPIALVSVCASGTFAQERLIKGRIVDEAGEPLAGATIIIKGTQNGTAADENGNFQISVSAPDAVLVISYYGMEDQDVRAGDGNTSLNVTLKSSEATSLSEAVVIGYGSVNKKQYIGGASNVKGEAFENKAMGSFTNMLQGKAPGIQIVGSNGAPGGNAIMRIRGTGSLNGDSNPLVVIDGVVSTTDALNSLNPTDILDIDVLKDASTTAIYGSRGSNGVILVKTKRGGGKSGGPAKISYGAQFGLKRKTPDKFKLMNFDEKLKFERDLGYTNEYLAPMLDEDGYSDISEVPEAKLQEYYSRLRNNETDWISNDGPILRNGKMQQHDISISGSTEKLSYYLSGQIYDEEGISLGSFFNRKAGSFTIDYKAKEWLTIGQSTRAAYNSGRLLRDRYNVQNPFVGAYFYNPYESPYDFAGGYNGYNATTQGFNVVEGIQGNPSFYNNLFLFSTTYLNLNLTKNLVFRTQIGMQYNNYQQENFTKPGSLLDMIINGAPVGTKTDITDNNFNYVWSNTLAYKKEIGEKGDLDVLIGTEFTKNNYKRYSLSSQGFPFGVNTQENGGTPTATSTSRTEFAMMSYFARAAYTFDDKYSLSASLRTDGSSKFGDDKKFGTFGSVGASWDIAEEAFMKNKSLFSGLKLWVSAGTSGNEGIPNYAHQDLYGFSKYANSPTGFPKQAGNSLLTWEKSANYSAGLDYELLNSRISGNITYYYRNTYDLLMRFPLSTTTGFTDRWENIGAMNNQGVEFQVLATLIRNKDFTWSIGGNITNNRNRITDLGERDSIPSANSYAGLNAVGNPIDVYYMQKYAGVDPTTGASLWYKEDGTTTDVYGDAGVFILDKKSPDPKFFGGFNTNLSYKNISLGVDFSFTGGHWTYNNQWKDLNNASNYYQNLAQDAGNYWTPENTGAANPALDINDGTYDSDRWLQRANLLRLRNVTLAYVVPNRLTKKLKLESLRVYLQGQNLWYYAPGYKGDPEVGIGSAESQLTRVGNIALFSYPQTQAYTFGLNVTF